MVVEVKTFGDQAGPSPRQIASEAHAIGCRWWDLEPDNFAPKIDLVTHVLIPATDIKMATSSVKAMSKFVTTVTSLNAEQFDKPPGPTGTPTYHSGTC